MLKLQRVNEDRKRNCHKCWTCHF